MPSVTFRRARRLHRRRLETNRVIADEDILRRALTVLRAFGPLALLRCLRASLSTRASTFLEVVNGGA